MSRTDTFDAPAAGQPIECSRRRFLVSALGGLSLGFVLPELLRPSLARAAAGGAAAAASQVTAWLRVGADESITLTVGSSEMGQGSFSGLAQVLAEDLMVDYGRVVTAQGGPTLATPAAIGTAINTVGSSVTRTNYWKLRDAAASAREMLVTAAMNAVGDLTRGNYTVSNGVITYTPTGQTLSYGQVAAAAALVPPPANPPLVPDAQFKVIGKVVNRVDIPLKVDGSAKYGIDVRLPNMLYGIVRHGPAFGATLATTFAAPVIPAAIAGRLVFYNNSAFDGNDPNPGPADDGAIDPTKSALLPGQTAGAANLTDYDKGINGIMVDVSGLPQAYVPTGADFQLLSGNAADPTTWSTVPTIGAVAVRRGAGTGSADRITVTLPDRSVINAWLRVTVLANANTGLTGNDVFYFGNLIADVTGNGVVSTGDVAAAKYYAGLPSDVTTAADVNRNGAVTTGDVAIAKYWAGTSLPMITAPAVAAAAPGPAKLGVVPVKVAATTNRGTEAVGNVNAVVVVGDNTWDTWQAARGLNVTWNTPTNAASLNSPQFVTDGTALTQTATPFVAGGSNGAGTLFTVEGDAPTAGAAIAASPTVLDNTYVLPYVSHATMEVLNCTVNYVPGVKCDVYAPTQSAKTAMSLVVSLTGLAASQVSVHTTYLGGGLGRKAEVDFISQAVQAAMVVKRPVKVMWPREEDFTRDQYRPMAVVRAQAGLSATGAVNGFAYRNVSPSILGQRGAAFGKTGDSQGYDGSEGIPYNWASHVIEWVWHPSPIPVGFWRSVGASINTFAVESMIDEMAFAAGTDPYQYRRGLLTDPRWLAVLDAAANLGNWATPPASGHARGIAIGTAFNSIVAEVVEISNVTTTSLRVNRVSVAIDCYLTVNPGQVENQLIGGVVHGMNAALYGKQTFVNGAAQARNFNASKMMRMGEMPQVDVTIIPPPAQTDRTKAIGGVGELGVPTFAPALANAYFKLTGTRVRTLPFFPNATMSDL